MVTDRPDQTESAVVVPRGLLQIEAGGERDHTDAMTVGATLLRFGIHPRVEARLGFGGFQRAAGLDGVADAEVGFKAVLSREGSLAELAVLGHVSVPTGSTSFTSDRFDPSTRIALAVPLTDRLSFGANGGMTWTAGRADGLYTAVVGLGASERIGLFAEVFGTIPVRSGSTAAHSVDGGITFGLTPTLQLDASGGVGLNAAAPEWFVGFGISTRFGW